MDLGFLGVSQMQMTQASKLRIQNSGVNIANEESRCSRDKIVSSLSKSLRELSFPSSRRCIYRVPERFRGENPREYTPKVVSIGPLHHGAKKLPDMEEQKLRYLHHFINRANLNLEELVKWVEENEQKVRDSYAEKIKLPSDRFIEMILKDSAFVLEFILCRSIPRQDVCRKEDLIYGKPWSYSDIKRDLFLLENQLPLFILVDLLAKIPQYREGYTHLIRLASFFMMGYIDKELVETKMERFMSGNVEHLLHMALICYQPSEVSEEVGELETIPGVFDLHQAGIQFKVNSSKNISDVQFKDGILEIPRLKIWDPTESFLRNLIAFEQCHFFMNSSFSHYAVLMEWLVNTPKDAELLIEKKIISRGRGTPAEVNHLLVNLGHGIIFGNFQYKKLCQELNAHCMRRRNKWKANLKQNYFNTPWAAISVAAAILLLVLTFLQTIFSGMSLKC